MERKANENGIESSSAIPNITLVLPVCDQARILGKTLKAASTFNRDHGGRCEVIVVDDASTDGSAEVAARWTEHLPNLHVLRHNYPRGKGAAARTGVLVARGKKIVVIEPDLAVSFDELGILLDTLDAGADVAIASRALQDSEIRRDPPFVRRMFEGVLRFAARFLVRPGVRDTFCGVHAFLHHVGRAIAERAHSTQSGYAAEWIAIAQRLGLHVIEVPVRWSQPELGQTKIAFLPTLAELARAGKRLKDVEYLAPLPAEKTLADTAFVRADKANQLWRSKFEPRLLVDPPSSDRRKR